MIWSIFFFSFFIFGLPYFHPKKDDGMTDGMTEAMMEEMMELNDDDYI